MQKGLAFFPWVYSDELIEIGPLRLIPWRRNEVPADLPSAKLADIDAVLNAYSDRPDHAIPRATLLEYGDWKLGDNPTEFVSKLFQIRQLIGFSALASRRLFCRGQGYCGYDSYILIVQKYQQEEPGTFAFTTRRRDGPTNQLWSSDEYAFHRPHHVNNNSRIGVEHRLLQALLLAAQLPDYILHAINEFNLANTDSPDVPEHIEIVMMKSAFERLFQISERRDDFCRKLKAVVGSPTSKSRLDTENASLWREKRPGSERLIECWAKEFCDIRGAAAHGSKKGGVSRFVWTEFYHLAFSAILFPLLVKRELSELGLLKLNDYDLARLNNIELYLATDPDPLPIEGESNRHSHPWQAVEAESVLAVHASRMHDL